MKTLSSSLTPLTKFIFPAMFVAIVPIWVLAATEHKQAWLFAALWTAVGAFVVWWTLPIKKVRLEGERFWIINFVREVEVPTAHLDRFIEDRDNRTPNLTLFFTPSTPFGSEIRIVPPFGFEDTASFDDVAATLSAIVSRNRGAESRLATRITTRVMRIIEHPVSLKTSAVVELTEPELDDLIDNLPHDLELRDFARRERQKRWYG
jgi:hypothetical protein